ncbi:spore cortex biosynthesis protein YabQ [Virgibacillus doumboii]|uniref:spore cortex biosynthesis protein YabQ n=1 Tax=Virgibacillus doumboii TaxID=2697503 RepID=UPI0013E0721A|nr:spore cortex biosynthesis protein YabQ [Virgibacillus doumboii]
MTLSVQFLTMISMVLGGFYLGIIQDTHRRFSIHWKQNKFLTYFMEISFWLTQTMLLYYVLFQVNSGELRFYVFAANLLGFSIYQVFAANAYKRFLEHVIRVCLNVYQFIEKVVQRLIITPVKFLIQLLITTVLFLANLLMTVIRYVAKIIFTPISWLFQRLFRLLPKNIQNYLHKLAGFYSTIENIVKKWLKYFPFKRR